MRGRRLQRHGGVFTKAGQLIAAPLPEWLAQLSGRVHRRLDERFFSKAPSHVLVNSYQSGEGILPHADGPCYEPHVAILSLGSPAVFRFYPAATNSTAGRGAAAGSTHAGEACSGVAQAAICDAAACSELRVPTHAGHLDSEDEGRNSAPCSRSVGRCSLCSGLQGSGAPSAARDRTYVASSAGAGPCLSVVLPPRSLLAFRGALYSQHLHGIDAVECETLDPSVINPDAAPQCASRCAAAQDDPNATCGQGQGGTGTRDAAGFERRGERVSLTFRNAAREVHVFARPRRHRR